MATASHGEVDHRLLHDFEVAVQELRRMGLAPRAADRAALALAYSLTGSFDNKEQVWAAVGQIFPKEMS